jgi:nitrite reductase/ring-hydroxylating ferredoxin subunit
MSKNLDETIKRVITDDAGQSDERDVRAATATFQADFPYEREQETQVTRREFCNFLGLTSAALFLGTGGFAGKAVLDARESDSFTAARITGAESLAPNSALNFNFPTASDSAILIRTADGAYHAFGQQCTHLSCPVYYSREHQRLECPCHEGAFDAVTGSVLYGPPPRPLDAVEIETRGGEVWAVGRRASTDEHAS